MVLGFYTSAGDASSSAMSSLQGLASHHQSDAPPSRAALYGSAWTVTTGRLHQVLKNGHGIKHLSVHRGYAIAPDGVRLHFELFDSHEQSADGTNAPQHASCYNVQAFPLPVAAAAPLMTGGGEMLPPSAAAATATALPVEGRAAGGGPRRQRCGCFSSTAEKELAVVLQPSGTAAKAVAAPKAAEKAPAGMAVGAEAKLDGTAPRLDTNTAPAAAAATATTEEVANVVLIMGFAASRHGWLPLIQHWMEQADSEVLHRQRARFCVFDNRGIGDSDSPPHRSSYSTTVMARDALAVMDCLGWHKAHVVGFSMGGMIALRLAVEVPERLLSLTVLSVTNGGWQAIPTRWRALKLLLSAMYARTPHQRARADVHFHFSRDTLHAEVPISSGNSSPVEADAAVTAQARRRMEAALIDEYVSSSLACAPQPQEGLRGQLHAVWSHGLSVSEQHCLRQLAVPFKIIHGYHDMIAMPAYGERIAKDTGATLIMLHAGHFVPRECAPEVCMHIADSIASAHKLK